MHKFKNICLLYTFIMNSEEQHDCSSQDSQDDSSNQNDSRRKRGRGGNTSNKFTLGWKKKRLMYIQSINRQKQEERDAFDPKPIKSSLTDNWLDAAFEKLAYSSFFHTRFPIPWVEKSFDMAHGLRNNHNNSSNKNFNDLHTRLWHVTDIPQRPSFLDFLLKCASVKLKQTELYGDIDRGGHFEEVDVSATDDQSRIRVSNQQDSSSSIDTSCSIGTSEGSRCCSNNSDDDRSSSTIGTATTDISSNAKISKQLLKRMKKDKSVYAVQKWVGNQQEIEMHQEECQQMHLSLDETAAVALSILTEEIMVSSLLSLARRHVALCRHKTDNGSSSSIFVSTDAERIGVKCISKMTLPAHEAIVDMILEQGSNSSNHTHTCCIPSSQPPLVVSSQTSWYPFLPTVEELLSHSMETMMDMQQHRLRMEYLQKWRIRNNYNHDFLQDNQDLFRLFVGNDDDDPLDFHNATNVSGKDHGDNDGKKKCEQSTLDEIQKELEKVVQGSAVSMANQTSEFPIPMIFTSFKNGDLPKQEL